ncbi:MAG: hypothetical protein ACLRMZ_03135 [Blautia marasmi]
MTVLKRQIYHFTWSCEDTGCEDYHVNYGISKVCNGPVKYLYPVLLKTPETGVLGTGHHCIFKGSGKILITWLIIDLPLLSVIIRREKAITVRPVWTGGIRADGLMKPVYVNP